MTVAVPGDGPADDEDPEVARTAAYVQRQASIRERIAVNVMARLGRVFDAMQSPLAPEDPVPPEFLANVQAGQRATARSSAAYISGLLDGAPDANRTFVAVDLPDSLRVGGGIDPSLPYRRPFTQWSRDLARGVALDVARARARQRLMVMADSDLTTAMREAVRQSVADHPDVIGMRRVIHPELSRGGVCGLCVAASDRLYSKRILMPIHARCVCEPVVVTREHDPGLKLNTADFAAIYGPDNVTDAAGLKHVLFAVDFHGEYGPVLRRADDHFEPPDPRAHAIELERDDHGRPPATVTPIALAKAPRELSASDLDAAMQDAIARDDFDRFDALAAETDRRDADRNRRRERRQERSRARDEQQAAELEHLLAAGQDEESAVSDVYGVSVDRQRRDRAIALLRNNGYTGASFDALTRAAFTNEANRAYLTAEDATRGTLLNRDGLAAGIDPRSLFKGPEARARRYASEELLAWWDEHGRLTLEELQADLLGAGAAAGAIRSGRSGFLS